MNVGQGICPGLSIYRATLELLAAAAGASLVSTYLFSITCDVFLLQTLGGGSGCHFSLLKAIISTNFQLG